jgi:hypothetical protein
MVMPNLLAYNSFGVLSFVGVLPNPTLRILLLIYFFFKQADITGLSLNILGYLPLCGGGELLICKGQCQENKKISYY